MKNERKRNIRPEEILRRRERIADGELERVTGGEPEDLTPRFCWKCRMEYVCTAAEFDLHRASCTGKG